MGVFLALVFANVCWGKGVWGWDTGGWGDRKKRNGVFPFVAEELQLFSFG